MTVKYITENIGLFGTGFILVLMTLIQIAPIKLDPWSSIARRVGRAMNKEVLDKVDSLSVEIKQSKIDNEERWTSLTRSSILRFGDEISHDIRHTKEHFDEVLSDINIYEEYCLEHPNYKNNRASATIDLIKKTYQKCLETNTFL